MSGKKNSIPDIGLTIHCAGGLGREILDIAKRVNYASKNLDV